MSDYRRYCFAQSGNAYKIALMLTLCGARWMPRYVRFFEGETFTPAYLEINDMGEVPVLEFDGQRMTQSAVVLEYLVQEFGRFGWNDESERREVMRWLFFDNHKLSHHAAVYRFMVDVLDAGDTPAARYVHRWLKAALRVLDDRLTHRPFVIGDRVTIADLTLSGYLHWNDEFGETWEKLPNIPRWLDRIKALPQWVHPYELMPGHPISVDKATLNGCFGRFVR